MTKAREITFDTVIRLLPNRPCTAHKGTFGTAGIMAGSFGMAGAAVLSAKAAVRTGVGIAKLIIPQSIYNIASASVPEAVCTFLPEQNGKINGMDPTFLSSVNSALYGTTAVLAGCGIGVGNETRAAMEKLIKTAKIPLVIDADGINTLAPDIEFIKQCKAGCIITPHPKEAARLLCCNVGDIEADRTAAVLKLAEKSGACAILKGHNTLVATASGDLFVCKAGNPGMATAGSGDVLSGIIVSLLAQGLRAADAASCGVYLHAAAGDIAAEQMSQTAMCASDIINCLPSLFKKFEGVDQHL